MSEAVKIDFEPDVLAALKARAAEIHRTLSQVVNELLRQRLEDQAAEDRADYEAAAQAYRTMQRTYSMEEVERELGLDD
jgi:plasmid stability protein